MCTIIALYGVRSDYPLVLATNRDEFYARPSTGAVRLLDAPPSVGGRDLGAGGSWMAVTADGLFVGVTNQRTFAPPRAAALSRGQLVLSLLPLADVGAIKAHLRAVDAREYNDFNLMFGTADDMWLAYGRHTSARLCLAALPRGLHVLPNDELDSAQFPKCARARALVDPHRHASWPQLRAALESALSDGHTVPMRAPAGASEFFDDATVTRLSALCVRTPDYGTRSSTIVALARGRCAHYLYADGPPDTTPFEDVTGLFAYP